MSRQMNNWGGFSTSSPTGGSEKAHVDRTSACPFGSSGPSQVDKSIETIVYEIVHKTLHQPQVDCRPYIAVLRQNLITTESALLRLNPQRLTKLNLPLLLEQELETYCKAVKPSKLRKTSSRDAANTASAPDSNAAFGLDASMRAVLKNSWQLLASSHETGVGSPLHQFFVYAYLGISGFSSVGPQKQNFLPMQSIDSNFIAESISGKILSFLAFPGIVLLGAAPPPLVTRVPLRARAVLIVWTIFHVLMSYFVYVVNFIKTFLNAINADVPCSRVAVSSPRHRLDDPTLLIPVLKALGVRHLIYGVEMRNFQSWGLALAKTMESVLGPETCTREIKEAWFCLIQQLGTVMMQDYDVIRAGFQGQLYKREGAKWRLYDVTLTHEKLSLFKNPERTVVKEEIWLNLIDDLQLLDTRSAPGAYPTKHAFQMSAGGALRVDLCALSDADLLKWMEDLSERVRAHQRAQPSPSEIDNETSSNGSSASDHASDLDDDLIREEQGIRKHSPILEDSGELSEDDDDVQSAPISPRKYDFVGFTGSPRKQRLSESQTLANEDMDAAKPAKVKKNKWRAKAEKKIRELQASLQVKAANKQKPKSS